MQWPRQAAHIQESVPTPLDHFGQGLDDGSFEQIDGRCGGAGEYDIARHVTPFRFADTPQRTTPFECSEHHERAAHDEGRQHAPPRRATHEATTILTIHGPGNIEGTTVQGPANRLRQGYGGPPKLYAKAEAGLYVRWNR